MKKITKQLWKITLIPVSFYYYKQFSMWKEKFPHHTFFKFMVENVDYQLLETQNIIKKIFIAYLYALAIAMYRFASLKKAIHYLWGNKKNLTKSIEGLDNLECMAYNIRLPKEFCYKPLESPLTKGRNVIHTVLGRALPLENAYQLSKTFYEVTDVIIPIYNGIKHLQKLIPSLFAHTRIPHRFIFIDDCSSDEQIIPYLQKICSGREDCLLVQNSQNRGFPATVNKGAELCSSDFVILNTDTEVPADWLERLLYPLRNNSSIASVTPFSNAATIFSFPDTDDDIENRKFLESFGLQAIDEAFFHVPFQGNDLDTPTAVGFCMAISYRAWCEIGGFDSKRYGRGYGEEVDWCRRAIAKGWRHVLAPYLFVAHYHGGSFTSEEKLAQCRHADELHKQLYPDYLPQVMKHIASDPWGWYRAVAIIRMHLRYSCEHILYLSHNYGGGATEFMNESVALEAASGACIMILRYHPVTKEYNLQIVFGKYIFNIDNVFRDDFLKPEFAVFSRIVVNELVGWPTEDSFGETITWIKQLKEHNKCRLEFMFHDFYAICPNINLLKKKRFFCHLESKESECQKCANNSDRINTEINIFYWRRNYEILLSFCDTVRFFSHNTKKYVEKIININDKSWIINEHKNYTISKNYFTPLKDVLHIAVIGSIGEEKGSFIIEELADELAKLRPDAKIFVIGKFAGTMRSNIFVTEPYDKSRLLDILTWLNISVCFFSSVWPETFSFVTQELMTIKAPVVAFNLGAPAERLASYPYAKLINSIDAKSALFGILEMYENIVKGKYPL